MAELRGRIAGRWPVAVLAVAVMVAVSLGDIVSGWYSFAGRGPSAHKEYPIRIVLPPILPVETGDPIAALVTSIAAAGEQAVAEAIGPDAAPGEALPEVSPHVEAGRTAAEPGMSGLLAVRFDLAEPGAFRAGDAPSAIEIRKAVRLNGADAGSARIRVDASSTLSIAREELGQLLAAAGQQELIEHLGAGEPFVSFDEMRRRGIEVRYDPVSDRILVSI